MRHLVKHTGLGRSNSHKKALLRNLATSLFEAGQISTTLGRAKALRPFVERLITVAKTKENLTAIRSLSSVLYSDKAVKQCFEYANSFKNRKGGYLRVLKNGFRYGDHAPVGVVQFVEKDQATA